MPTHNYMKLITEILSKGPLLSTDITKEMVLKFGIKDTYAKNLLSKYAKQHIIYSSYPLLFDNGQYAYSLEKGNNQYVNLLHHKPRLNNIYIEFIRYRVISQLEILKLSGALAIENTKYYDLTKVIKDLEYFFPNIKSVVINESLFYHNNLDPKELNYAYEQKLNERKLDIEFLPAILNYMHRINIISRKSLYTSLDKPFEGIFVRQNIPFDASGFTGIGNANKEATVVVFDVKIDNEYKWNDFSGFKYRVETLINSTKKYNQRVIPVIVANEFEHGKYLEVKADNRFMILQLKYIFGSRIQDFLDTIKISKFDKMSDAIKSLKILDDTGLTSQLFNFLPFVFESFVSELLIKYFNKINYHFGTVERSKHIYYGGNHKEFDVWFENENEILAVECKFHKRNMIKWEELKKDKAGNERLVDTCGKYFFEEKYRFLIDSGVTKQIKMVFIAANGFYKTMHTEVNKTDSSRKHDKLELILSGKDLLDLCQKKNVGIKEYRQWFNKVFIKNKKENEFEDSTD